jgi:hypothetical protein
MNWYDRVVLPYVIDMACGGALAGPRPMTFHYWGQAQAA